MRLTSLIGTAGVSGMALCGMGLLLKAEQSRSDNMPLLIKYALRVVGEQKRITDLIGEPYTLSRPKVEHEAASDGSMKIIAKVPIKGQNDTAYLFAHAYRPNPKEKYKLFKIEMEFNQIKGKRLVVLEKEQVLLKAPEKPKTKKTDWTKMKPQAVASNNNSGQENG